MLLCRLMAVLADGEPVSPSPFCNQHHCPPPPNGGPVRFFCYSMDTIAGRVVCERMFHSHQSFIPLVPGGCALDSISRKGAGSESTRATAAALLANNAGAALAYVLGPPPLSSPAFSPPTRHPALFLRSCSYVTDPSMSR